MINQNGYKPKLGENCLPSTTGLKEVFSGFPSCADDLPGAPSNPAPRSCPSPPQNYPQSCLNAHVNLKAR